MKRTDFYLTEAEVKALQILKDKTGIGKSEHIRRAIDEYINKKKWEGIKELEKLDM